MKYYRIYNLCIASEFDFPEFIEIEGKVDANIRFGKVDDAIATQAESNKAFVGSLPEICRIWIYNGEEIVIEPEKDVDESLIRTAILGPILCVLLRQRGLLVIHASCVNINNQGVAFMGGSGWGKSTLATAFHTKGYDVLTDDVLPIKIENNRAIVYPSYPQFKLCLDAATSLGQETKKLLPVYTNSSKVAYIVSHKFQKNPIPLQQIYLLHKGTEHQITSLKRQETFVELVRHTRSMKSMTEEKCITQHLHFCSELIKNVRFCRFTRKPSLADLPKLINLVEEDLAAIQQLV
ncbi:hypothetical protein NIES267_68100 [Calothrix parasitica NIES-267]|uniref:HPr kinase n=1 Tax=Calothrix parasitica NIES-267 TaxID=1973488 RepID=A0A1Z4M1D2_9CYAN|nr:hypothetical protein NIES267_68100 [Calothrix parasitica NIES-267]